MGAFTPFKRHANKFNYTPRYYDPAKEAREQRRAEMYGERSDQKSDEEGYRPGQYIRTSSAARSARLSGGAGGRGGRNRGSSQMRMIILIGAIAIIAYLGSVLYSSLIEALDPSSKTTRTEEYEEFNPYTPITIVPNDYDPTQDK